ATRGDAAASSALLTKLGSRRPPGSWTERTAGNERPPSVDSRSSPMFPVGQTAHTTPPPAATSAPPSSARHGPFRVANVRPPSDETATVSKSGRRRGGPRNQTFEPRAASEK